MSDRTLFDAPPYQRHSETSRAAAASQAGSRANIGRETVLEFLRGRGEQGATDDEIQGWTGLSESTERPRRVELVRAGLVVDAGEKRKTSRGRLATVWRAAS